MRFRSDIGGLRAIAVTAVLLYHFQPSWLPGGFLGVDIFFVISGFLITSIISDDMVNGTFSFTQFYKKRARRLLPLFFFVVFFVLLVGFFILLPNDFRRLINSALASSLFLGNFYFALQGGYFESAGEYPLLHMWSLSVEEQFYFIWPLVLFFIHKNILNLKTKSFIVVCFILISLTLGTYLAISERFSQWSYFLILTRMGELLVGALIAINIRNINLPSYAAYLGFALIISSFIFIDESIVFPGLITLIPCVGVSLLLLNKKNYKISSFLGNRPFNHIGELSYSIYLWHWPFVAYISYYYGTTEISLLATALSVCSIYLLSLFSKTYVEDKFRKNSNTSSSNVFLTTFAIPTSLIVFVMFTSIKTDGFSFRISDGLLNENLTSYNNVDKCIDSLKVNCSVVTAKISKESGEKIILFGDSHSAQLYGFFEHINKSKSINVDAYSSSSCAPTVTNVTVNCRITRTLFWDNVDKYDSIMVAAKWSDAYYSYENEQFFAEKLTSFLNKLLLTKKNIYIFTQVPEFKSNPYRNFIYKNIYNTDNKIYPSNKSVVANQALRTVLLSFPTVGLIDNEKLMCQSKSCALNDEDGNILYMDNDHLNYYGSKYLADKFLKSGANYNNFPVSH